jgi:Mor family transcriptional regulator
MTDFIKKVSDRVAKDPRIMQAVSDIIAEVLHQELFAEHKGTKLYVPKTLTSTQRSDRDVQMRLKFNGHNYIALAKEFALTVRQTRRIINMPELKTRDSDIRG